MAEQLEMDLVEVAPQARPPVCKIMDYGKYKYQLAKKAQEAKKRQAVIQIKEVKIRPKTEEHDFQVKLKQHPGFPRGRRQGQGDRHVPRPRGYAAREGH